MTNKTKTSILLILFLGFFCQIFFPYQTEAISIFGGLQKYEYDNSGGTPYDSCYGDYWCATTFTVGSSAHTVTSVKIQCQTYGSPGTYTLGIRAISGEHPADSDLTSGTFSGSSCGSGGWVTTNVAEYTLSASTTYAIVVRSATGDPNNRIMWYGHDTGSAREMSTSSGSYWTHYPGTEMYEVIAQKKANYLCIIGIVAGILLLIGLVIFIIIKKRRNKYIPSFVFVVVAFIIVLLVGSGIYFWQRSQLSETENENIQQVVQLQKQIDNLNTQLNKLSQEKEELQQTIYKLIIQLSPKPEPERYIKVISPNGKETLCLNDDFIISWDSKGVNLVTLSVEQSDAGSIGNYIIGTVLATSSETGEIGKGSYVWKVGKTRGTVLSEGYNYKIRISSADSPTSSVKDTSDSFFEISICKG